MNKFCLLNKQNLNAYYAAWLEIWDSIQGASNLEIQKIFEDKYNCSICGHGYGFGGSMPSMIMFNTKADQLVFMLRWQK